MIDFKKRRKALRQAATNRPELRWEGKREPCAPPPSGER